MNYRDFVLESYFEDDDYDMYDSYDEEYDEYDEYDEDDSDYEDAYLEGYMYALMEANRSEAIEAERLGLNPHAKPGTPEYDAYRAWVNGERVVKKIEVERAEEAGKNSLQRAKERGSVTQGKRSKVHRTKFNDAELNADLARARQSRTDRAVRAATAQGAAQGRRAGAVRGAAIAATAIGATAGVGVGVNAAVKHAKNKKEWKEYAAAGGKLPFKNWLDEGKPKPKATDAAIKAVKDAPAKVKAKIMKEAYDNAYDYAFEEAFIDGYNSIINY